MLDEKTRNERIGNIHFIRRVSTEIARPTSFQYHMGQIEKLKLKITMLATPMISALKPNSTTEQKPLTITDWTILRKTTKTAMKQLWKGNVHYIHRDLLTDEGVGHVSMLAVKDTTELHKT